MYIFYVIYMILKIVFVLFRDPTRTLYPFLTISWCSGVGNASTSTGG